MSGRKSWTAYGRLRRAEAREERSSQSHVRFAYGDDALINDKDSKRKARRVLINPPCISACLSGRSILKHEPKV